MLYVSVLLHDWQINMEQVLQQVLETINQGILLFARHHAQSVFQHNICKCKRVQTLL